MTKIVIITGPTASGKSALAQQFARERNAVIINADSQQLYKELPILTARPSAQEEATAPHKLYGVVSILDSDERQRGLAALSGAACVAPSAKGAERKSVSVAWWLKQAVMEIEWALGQGKQPLIVGGTGMYIQALVEGISDIPDVPPEVRAQAINDLNIMGGEAFKERLSAVDPVLGEKLKSGDSQRLTRAWEVFLATGKALSWWQAQGKNKPLPNVVFEIHKVELPREELYARCDARFLKMLEMGALKEVRELGMWRCGDEEIKSSNPLLSNSPSLPIPIIGHPELSAHLRGEITLEEATTQAQQATRNYAKRQMTWLRNQLRD